MTGNMGGEVSDASATGMFSTAKRDWAWELLERFDLPKEIFPPVAESSDIAGAISRDCAKRTGLPQGIPVVYGAGDQQAQSIGNGVIRPGRVISNIGTGGQISAFFSKPVYDRKLRTNTETADQYFLPRNKRGLHHIWRHLMQRYVYELDKK